MAARCRWLAHRLLMLLMRRVLVQYTMLAFHHVCNSFCRILWLVRTITSERRAFTALALRSRQPSARAVVARGSRMHRHTDERRHHVSRQQRRKIRMQPAEVVDVLE